MPVVSTQWTTQRSAVEPALFKTVCPAKYSAKRTSDVEGNSVDFGGRCDIKKIKTIASAELATKYASVVCSLDAALGTAQFTNQ